MKWATRQRVVPERFGQFAIGQIEGQLSEAENLVFRRETQQQKRKPSFDWLVHGNSYRFFATVHAECQALHNPHRKPAVPGQAVQELGLAKCKHCHW